MFLTTECYECDESIQIAFDFVCNRRILIYGKLLEDSFVF